MPDLIISLLAFSLLAPAHADERTLKAALDAETRAMNDYYRARKALRNPTPEKEQALRNEILAPARKSTADRFQSEMQERQAQAKSGFFSAAKREAQEILASLGASVSKPVIEKTRKWLDELRAPAGAAAPRTEFTTGGPSSPETGAIPGASGGSRPAVVLDGSNIPREVEFPGTKK